MKLTAHLYVLFEFKNIGAIPPTPPCVFTSWCLIKHKDNFTFTVFLFVEHDRTMRSLSLFPVAPTSEHKTSVRRFVSVQFLKPKTVGRTP
jgi:hypothetical protein